MIKNCTLAPDANPHKLVKKTSKNGANNAGAQNANHDKLLTKKGPSGTQSKLASRRGVSAAKAWPQRSIVACMHEKLTLLKPPSLYS